MVIGLEELNSKKQEIISSLKDFQLATVERVSNQFNAGRKRVLVADEVGLGKTLIARGTIINQAIARYESGNEICKVVYICSNQSIANQNISKLDVFNSYKDYASESRLSMQHLVMRESLVRNKDKFINLIPLTPDTSFRIGSNRASKGTVYERALIYVILKRMPRFNVYEKELKMLLSDNVGSFVRYVEDYSRRVEHCEIATAGAYPQSLIADLVNEDDNALNILEQHLIEIRDNSDRSNSETIVINSLRVLFASVSISGFAPDLVIMDEFQRFSYMTNPDKADVETNKLVDLFFNKSDVNVLLLSATPYKLYSTLDELEDSDGEEDHYSEFKSAVEFLINDNKEYLEFEHIWDDYSAELREYAHGEAAVIGIRQQAEDALYNSIARTERISVMDSGDFIDDSSAKEPISINKNDVISYLDIKSIVDKTDISDFRLVDYVKSCPYLLSYTNGYKLKQEIDSYYAKNNAEICDLDRNSLWLKYDCINSYSSVDTTNARVKKLESIVFDNGAERYLWVPPSMPYYQLQGAYKDSKLFSKVLVFSSWEMVPRMIGTYISYKVEKETIAKVAQLNNRSIQYTDSNRYLANKFTFDSMSTLAFVYPSITLAKAYKAYKYKNSNMKLEDIVRSVEKKLKPKLEKLKRFENEDSEANRKMWYYLAPALLDKVDSEVEYHNLPYIDNKNAYNSAMDRFNNYLNNIDDLKLGKMPDDLLRVLALLSIGSFASCSYRSNRYDFINAVKLSIELVYYFNTPESAAVVSLVYNEEDDDRHWKNILKYCVDGCFQAVLDEYFHIVSDGIQLMDSSSKSEHITKTIIKAFEYQTGSYRTYINPVSGNEFCKEYINMRAHYAVGFRKTSTSSGNDGDVVRKDSIRNAFNSPFKPFVLATTSIGQEGLDFHQYCRKIMHWNLPSNPIDLEQREGRINRYKCLAIRQNIAQHFCDEELRKDVWDNLFVKAVSEYRKEGQSELVPYWCLGENQQVKIERIIPMYPISKDNSNYERLVQILSLYRLTLGQSRQEELVEHFLNNCDNVSDIKNQLIDLSPFSRVSDAWKKSFKLSHTLKNDNDTDYLNLVDFRNKKSMIEDEILSLEIELDELPVVAKGTQVIDNLDNVCVFTSFDEEHDTCEIEYEDGRKKSFKPSLAIGKKLIINDIGYRDSYEKRKEIKTQISIKYSELEAIETRIDELE